MRSMLLGVTIVFLFSAPDVRGQDSQRSSQAARKIAATMKRYEDERRESSKTLGRAKTEVERQAVISRIPRPAHLCPGLWKIVEAHPADAAVAEALAWIAQHDSDHNARLRAVDILLRDFMSSRFVEKACAAFSYFQPTQRVEQLLRTIVERSPHAGARGTATFQLSWIVAARDRTPAGAKEEIRLLELVRKNYPSVRHWRKGTLGQAAENRLFELRHLVVGRTAPEIDGEDVSGRRFKLTDYRGRVVLLDFWGHW